MATWNELFELEEFDWKDQDRHVIQLEAQLGEVTHIVISAWDPAREDTCFIWRSKAFRCTA